MNNDEIVNRLNNAKDKLASLSDSEKVKTVRALHWSMLKQTYKLIAKKGPLDQCLQVVKSLSQRIELDPKTAEKLGDARTLKYFIKMLKKYKRIV